MLVHGTGSTGLATWGTVLDDLAARHRVVLPDLPGSGGSPRADEPLDLDTVADQLVAAADDAGLDRFAVAGASLGAPIAIRVAARYPDRVSKLISVVGFAWPRPVLRLNLELWAALHEEQNPNVGKLIVMLSFSEEFLGILPHEQIGQLAATMAADPAPGTLAQIQLGLDADVRGDLGGVQAPTLVISAADDRFVAPRHSREIADNIPGAQLVEVPGGHASLFEDALPTLSAMLKFLA